MFKSREKYLQLESRFFAQLFLTQESQCLRQIYFLTEAAKKKGKSFSHHRSIGKGAVLGAGTMGGGLATLFAQYGHHPVVRDVSIPSLEMGLKQSQKVLGEEFKKKRITESQYWDKLLSIEFNLELSSLKSAELLIEAVPEDMSIKKKVLQEVETVVSTECLITSNTSSLSVQEMASSLKYPGRFAGLHFFNPVHRMPLVEIITHDKIDQATMERLYQWVLSVKKIPLVVKDAPGFLINRLLMPYLNACGFLLQEGVSVSQLDQTMLAFGMPMGPCRLMDEIGFDVLAKVAQVLEKSLGEKAQAPHIITQLVTQGFLGKKNNNGFYQYPSGKEFNQKIMDHLPPAQFKKPKLIQERLLLPMIEEAQLVLEQQIVATPQEVDLGLIYGMGFPPFRGGLLRYAQTAGIKNFYRS